MHRFNIKVCRILFDAWSGGRWRPLDHVTSFILPLRHLKEFYVSSWRDADKWSKRHCIIVGLGIVIDIQGAFVKLLRHALWVWLDVYNPSDARCDNVPRT